MFWIEGQKKFPKKLIGSIALLIGTINGAVIYYLKTLLDPRRKEDSFLDSSIHICIHFLSS